MFTKELFTDEILDPAVSAQFHMTGAGVMQKSQMACSAMQRFDVFETNKKGKKCRNMFRTPNAELNENRIMNSVYELEELNSEGDDFFQDL